MSDDEPGLPKRNAGTHLPPAAYRAKVPNLTDDAWHRDERTLRVLLNGLRRWQVNG